MVYLCDVFVAFRHPPSLRHSACQVGWVGVHPPATGQAGWEESPPHIPWDGGAGTPALVPLAPLPAVVEDRVWQL